MLLILSQRNEMVTSSTLSPKSLNDTLKSVLRSNHALEKCEDKNIPILKAVPKEKQIILVRNSRKKVCLCEY